MIAQTSPFKNQTILITGGTGSFGRSFANYLIQQDECHKIIIFSRDEWKQWKMQQSGFLANHAKLRYFLGDVRDSDRLKRAFDNVDIVIHAAALKQVPLAEYNPAEFIKTNINGAMNVMEAAIDCGVKRVIALSTDKAVNPVNLYGATKLCSDKLFISGNAYVGKKGYPKFSVVRYGNVSGTRGSIIPYWQELIAQRAKYLPITDENMTRFWITLEQTISFISDCLCQMKGGEIFVPKIPSVKIIDLAKAIAPNLPIEICGIRPGEKLNELLISADDSRHTLEYEGHYIIMPELPAQHLSEALRLKGNPVQPNFVYASHTNTQWLNVETIQQFLRTCL